MNKHSINLGVGGCRKKSRDTIFIYPKGKIFFKFAKTKLGKVLKKNETFKNYLKNAKWSILKNNFAQKIKNVLTIQLKNSTYKNPH